MAPRLPFDLESLSTAIPAVLDQVQSSAATHKKNCVALFKLHNASSSVVETVNRGRKGDEIKLIGEKAFLDIFLEMMNRVVVIKKGIPTADRIVKFVGSYVQFINDNNAEKNNDDDDDDTPFSRFISRLLKYLSKGFGAKSKIVRYRCMSFLSEIIAHIGELDQEMYAELRTNLLDRLLDKEPLVRAHCVTVLSKLAASEEPDDLEDDQQPIVTSLLNSLFYDPASEVRRAALIHLPFTPATLPALLTRSRDVDAVTRKLLYSSVLTRLAHPKQLTISQREQIVRQGLGDREEAVRLAAAKLLGSWVDLCEGDLIQFLKLFDVRAGDICVDALKSIFVARSEVVQELEFDELFWSTLKPESALLARTFVEHCFDKKDESRLEACLPVVTALAFLLQNHYNAFLEVLQEDEEAQLNGEEDDDDADSRDEKMADEEFMMSELLRLSLLLDYSDEIGRRKMFSVIRQMLAHPELPDSLITPCVGVIGVLSLNERDLIRVVVEVINELRDPEPEVNISDDEISEADMTRTMSQSGSGSFRNRKPIEEMSAEEKAQADIIDLHCLTISIAVLERVNGSFEENSTLEGILVDLIIPSVKRKELLLREKGLICLGLCCLIAKNMAMSSFQLFLSQVKNAPEALRQKVLQVVFDILMTYEKDLLGGAEDIGQRVIAFLMNVLETEESSAVQALICLGLCKLMLFGLVTDERVLTSLVLLYVSPFTVKNQELRQCLAYFLPVYCYSSQIHQDRMRSIFMTAYDLVTKVYEDLDDDQTMITPPQFGQLLVDWTDPTKVVDLSGESHEILPTHVDLVIDIPQALYESDRPPEDKKCLCQLLAKLTFPNEIEETKLYRAYILVSNLSEQCPFEDSATDKLFARFRQRFEHHFSLLLDGFDEQQCFEQEPYSEMYEFIGISRPRRRRFERQQVDDTPHASGSELERKVNGTTPAKNVSQDGDDSEESEQEPAPEASSSDREEEQLYADDEVPAHNPPPRNRQQIKKGKEKDAAKTRSKHLKKESKKNVSDGDSDDLGSEMEEVKENVQLPEPKTPPRKRTGKRFHTPTKTPSMPSPAPKRRAAISRNKKPTLSTKKQPLSNTTNKRAKVPTPPKHASHKQNPNKRSAKSTVDDELSEKSTGDDGDDDDDNDDSVETPQSPTQFRMPSTMEEKLGWGDSSDI